MAFTEVYTALSQGVLDGFVVTNSVVYSDKVYEVAPYAFETQMGGFTYFIGANRDALEALSDLDQKIVRDLSYEAWETLWETVPTENTKYREKLINEKGMEFTIAPDIARQLISGEASLKYWDEWAAKSGPMAPEMLDIIKKMVSGK